MSSNNQLNSRQRNKNTNSNFIPITQNTLISDGELTLAAYDYSSQSDQKGSSLRADYGAKPKSAYGPLGAADSTTDSGSLNSPESSTIYKNKSIPRPTLITGFTNGYNFLNHFVESPVDRPVDQPPSSSLLSEKFDQFEGESESDAGITNISKNFSSSQQTSGNIDSSLVSDVGSNEISSLNTPITIINKNLQNLQQQLYGRQTNTPSSPLTGRLIADSSDISNFLAPKEIYNYRTQPNSFKDSLIESGNLKPFSTEPINDENENSLPRKEHVAGSSEVSIGAGTQANTSGYQCSTLLERDFPAEILPFELLDKKDGGYFINNEKVSSLSNSNYGSLIDHDDMFSDVINPLQDARMLRMKSEKRLSRRRKPDPLDSVIEESSPSEKAELELKHKMRPRTYSESETANFSTITGERLYDDDKHRPIYSLHGNHEKLQDDSIHTTRNNSTLRVDLKQSQKEPQSTIYSALDIASTSGFHSPYNMSRSNSNMGPENPVQVPTNITIHGGTIVPDENYRPKFFPRKSYNKDFGLAKTHQISTSTLELLNSESFNKPNNASGKLLHPNVGIYHNFEDLLGCEDEYIPGLDFKTSISQWFDGDNDYKRFYKLQLIGSHVHDPKDSDAALKTINSIKSVKSFQNQDDLTVDMPNNDDNPILADPPHDYSYKEIALLNQKPEANDTIVESSQDNRYASLKTHNQNLKNYKKNILSFNEYDYNNYYGGHNKMKHIPNYLLEERKKSGISSASEFPDIKEEEVSKKSQAEVGTEQQNNGRDKVVSLDETTIRSPKSSDADQLFDIHSKLSEKPLSKNRSNADIVVLDNTKRNLSNNALTRMNGYNAGISLSSPRQPGLLNTLLDGHQRPLNVKFEHGTVVEKSGDSSTSSSLSSSPLVMHDLKPRLHQYHTDKLSNQVKNRGSTSTYTREKDEIPTQSAIGSALSQPESIPSSSSVPLSEETESKVVEKVNYEKLIDKLPDDFLQLPFSKRRKMLLDILPKNDKDNSIDSKLLLALIKKRFSTKTEDQTQRQQSTSTGGTSTAAKFLSRVNKAPTAKKRNIDDRGSIVMNHELGKIIGYGSWGIVRECYSLDEADNTITPNSADGSHRLVRAIKIVKTKNEIVRRCFKKEIRIWKLLNHKRLLPLLFVKETSYAIFCITPRIYGGTLFDIVSNWGFYNDPNSPIVISKRLLLIRRFIWEILDGLSYMHYNGIVHGDLKLENCLIDEIVNPITNKIENHILICDFGMSCFYIDPRRSRTNSISSARSSFTKLSALSQPSILKEQPNRSEQAVNRPLIPRSSSSEHLSVSFSKMHQIAFNRAITHDDTPAGISSFQKSYGPAPTSTTLNLSPIVFNYIQNEQPTNDKTPLPHTHIGSLPYASPEILLPNPPPLGPMADVWAFGVLTYTMVVGKLPFQHNFEPRLRAMISRGKYDSQCLQVAAGSDPALIKIIKGCLEKNITSRWDLDRVLSCLES